MGPREECWEIGTSRFRAETETHAKGQITANLVLQPQLASSVNLESGSAIDTDWLTLLQAHLRGSEQLATWDLLSFQSGFKPVPLHLCLPSARLACGHGFHSRWSLWFGLLQH